MGKLDFITFGSFLFGSGFDYLPANPLLITAEYAVLSDKQFQ